MVAPLLLGLYWNGLHAQVFVNLLQIGLYLAVRDHVHNPAALHDVVSVRDARGEPEVLLDQEDGKPFRLEPRDGVAYLLNDHRSEAFGWLVQKQQPRPGAQNAADREHLLLASGELRALAREALLQVREQAENLIDGQPARAHHGRKQEVFVNVEAREDTALLGAERDSEAGNAIGRERDDLRAVEADRALPASDPAHDGLESRCPA